MQTINTKHFGPISFVKTWVSSDGRHIGKTAKGGYVHLSGSRVSSTRDINDLIPKGQDREDALDWFKNKDKPRPGIDSKAIVLTSEGGYMWEDGSEGCIMSDSYIRFCPHCKLAYRPDGRTHKEPETYCPRCGKKLVKDSE
jgi:hypothetical protein